MKKKTFLKLPEYPGGNEEYRKYIIDNLHYPESAIEHNIEGVVHLSADVNDEGDVSAIRVDKGIGYGCDEEAIRLIEGIRFGGVKNRGVRVKAKRKFRVLFSLKEKNGSAGKKMEIRYSYKKTGEIEKPAEKRAENLKDENKFTYTIVYERK